MSNLFSILGREQSLGESYARLLHQHGRGDPASYGRGILLYAQAKAAFDGLIEEAKGYLAEGIDLAQAEGLELHIRAAVDRRSEFTDHVTSRVLLSQAGTRSGLGELPNPAELLKGLIQGLRALWQEYRGVQEARRKELRQQLDALKWRPFQDFTGS